MFLVPVGTCGNHKLGQNILCLFVSDKWVMAVINLQMCYVNENQRLRRKNKVEADREKVFMAAGFSIGFQFCFRNCKSFEQRIKRQMSEYFIPRQNRNIPF